MDALRQVGNLLPVDLDDAFAGVESTPGVCGAEPCIVRTRIPVWVLEQARRLETSEEELLRSYPTLRAEDLANAWAFVRSHRCEIEEQIRDNENFSFRVVAQLLRQGHSVSTVPETGRANRSTPDAEILDSPLTKGAQC
jgi:uncharacterized protein (DUF433 family)